MCVSSLIGKLSRIQLPFCNCHPRALEHTNMCRGLSSLTLNSNEWVSANLNICNHTYFAIEISCKKLQKRSTVSRYQWISNVRTTGTIFAIIWYIQICFHNLNESKIKKYFTTLNCHWWSITSRYQWISNVRSTKTMDNASVYLFGHFAFPADWITDQATDDGGQHTSCNVSCE